MTAVAGGAYALRLEAAANGLLGAAEELGRALDLDGDALAAALESRARAFAALRESIEGPLPERIRALLERVVELDQGLQARAEAKLADVRAELLQVRRAGRAMQAFDGAPKPPRFLSERA